MDFGHLDWDMGKYGLFVWGSYGVSFLALGALVVASLLIQTRRRKVLEALQAAADSQ
jgi:heme exporter protein CcmD